MRRDFHIVRKARAWHLENADGETLQLFRAPEDAFEAAQNRANEFQRRGFAARVTLHHPGRAPEVHDYPPHRE